MRLLTVCPCQTWGKLADMSHAEKVKPETRRRRQRRDDKPVLDPDKPLQGLTSKQERVAQLHVSGLDKSESYRRVFNVGPNTKPETVHRNAVAVFKNIKVKSRVQQLQDEKQKELAQINGPTPDKVLQQIMDIANDPEEKTADRLRALDRLAKITGLYDNQGDDDKDRKPEDVEAQLKQKLSTMLARIESRENEG